MPSPIVVCPMCQGPLAQTDTGFTCEPCERFLETVNGVPNFFVQESEATMQNVDRGRTRAL
jgi:uncharacterized protein YbaR (Trm112 family)